MEGYGKTFNNEKDKLAYAKYMLEKKKRYIASKTPEDKERAEIRKHFKSEAKHFNIK